MNTVVYGCFNSGTISSPTGANSGIIGWGGAGDSITISGCYNGGKIAKTDKITANPPTLDLICRNRSRETGDFSNSYYLASTCSDDYNEHNATKLTTVNNGFLAYAMDHALCNGQEYAVGKSLENNGETLAGLRFTNGLKRHLNKGSFKLTWFGAANDTANGTLFTLRFKVLQNKSLRVGLTLQPNTAYNADCTADA